MYSKLLMRFELVVAHEIRTQDVAASILQPEQGFDMRLCGTHGTSYGDGLYFAVNPAYSASEIYAPPDSNGWRYMFLVRVLVGKTQVTKKGMKRPDPISPTNPSILYDAGVDQHPCPTMYIIFDNAQVYPAYIVQFRTTK